MSIKNKTQLKAEVTTAIRVGGQPAKTKATYVRNLLHNVIDSSISTINDILPDENGNVALGIADVVGTTVSDAAIIGGVNNQLQTAAERSVVLGGQNINATAPDTVYVPNLNVNGVEVAVTGATTGQALVFDGTKYAPQTLSGAIADPGLVYNTTNPSVYAKWNTAANTTGLNSFNVGLNSIASGNYAHAEGFQTQATASYAHAEGRDTVASAIYSHAEGRGCIATGENGHAEGRLTTAQGESSHAEGRENLAGSDYSHAEGRFTTTSGTHAHAEGLHTTAGGNSSHTGGRGIATCKLTASAIASFNHSEVTADGVISATAVNSAILGGINHNIQSAATKSVVLGGQGINATRPDTVYMSQLAVINFPVFADNTAAIAGGLHTGVCYRTSAGDLKVVI